jgi:hypothetical protein
MSTSVTHQQLLRAAKALKRAQGEREAREAPEEHLLAIIRSSPVWASVPGGLPAPGQPWDLEKLGVFVRHCQVAAALGIEG